MERIAGSNGDGFEELAETLSTEAEETVSAATGSES
jgi:hypothetical protein